MPIKPETFRLSCSSCGWTKVFAPRSDVALAFDGYTKPCPTCGNESLTRVEANTVETVLKNIELSLTQILKRK